MTELSHPRTCRVCSTCGLHPDTSLCGSREPFSAMQSMKVTHSYRRGSTIFMEGQTVEGVYVLCSGRAKVSTCSEDGKTIILRIAEAGEALGLCAVLGNGLHENTAQAMEDSTVGFIAKKDFLHLIEACHEAALAALRQVTNNYYKAYMQVCSLGLSSSAGDKLARLLLQWTAHSENGSEVRIRRAHTHSEIAEMIGCSRETVTRLLGEFKDRGLIDFSRTELLIPDRRRLKTAIGTRYGYSNGNGFGNGNGNGDRHL